LSKNVSIERRIEGSEKVLILGILLFLFLTFVNIKIGKSLLYPPAIFSLVWSMFLFLLLLAGDLFYPIHPKTLIIYTLGALGFSLGGLFSILVVKTPFNPNMIVRQTAFIQFAGFIAAVILFAFLPSYWNNVQQTATLSGFDNIWMAVRVAELQGTRQISPILANMVPISIIFSLILFSLKNKSKFMNLVTLMVIVLSAVYNTLTAGRAGLMLLLLSLLGIYWIKNKKINIKATLIFGVVFIFAFSFAQIALGKAGASSALSLKDNIPILFEGFLWYAVGGVVAFNQVALFPELIPSTGGTFRVIKEFANAFGADFHIPGLHAAYTQIAPDKYTNVYTTYFYYYKDFGLFGTFLMMIFLGFVLTFVFKEAMKGNYNAIILYGLCFSGLVLTCFNEQFFWQFNLILKLVIIMAVVYWLPMFTYEKRFYKYVEN
jgi:oligosaccharide repeat unit polymerase